MAAGGRSGGGAPLSTSSLESGRFRPTSLAALSILVPLTIVAAVGSGCASTAECQRDSDCAGWSEFCTGGRRCVARRCRGLTPPCGPGESCSEARRTCDCVDPRLCMVIDAGVVTADAGPDAADAGRDGGPDASFDAGPCPLGPSGEACTLSASCSGSMACARAYTSYGSSVGADGTPGRELVVALMPGGYCAPACDPYRVDDECAPCGVCSNEVLVGDQRYPFRNFLDRGAFCRESCTPSHTESGCPRAGYTCDLETSSCMEACQDDAQCQITIGDGDGDGVGDWLDRGADYPAYCDAVTGRCRTRGTPGASIGDACADDRDCEDDGRCLREFGAGAGLCTRLGCRAAGFECPPPYECDLVNAGSGSSGCFAPCEVGLEDGTPAMLGPGGGHPSCGVGRACAWDGVSGAADVGNGSCIVGEYNTVAAANIGAPCTADDQCYSPFGLGLCLFDGSASWTGICSVRSCAGLPGPDGTLLEGLMPGVAITTPICDPARGEFCLDLAPPEDPDETYCLPRCSTAADCAPGYACREVAAPVSVCEPTCWFDDECRPGQRCVSTSADRACEPWAFEVCTCAP